MTSGHEKKASKSPPPTDIGERDKGDRQERSDRRRGGGEVRGEVVGREREGGGEAVKRTRGRRGTGKEKGEGERDRGKDKGRDREKDREG
jgi:hypothetical protein